MFFIFVTIFAGLVGCGKDDCDDTAAGACDTGESHEDHDHDGDDDGGDDDGGDDDGGDDDGGDEGGDDGGGDAAVSCTFSADICVEPNEADNDAWCSALGGTPAAEACADGADGHCEIPAGGDYTANATAYYYNGFDGAAACEGAGGTYTSAGGDWAETGR